jgi:predicted TIM-barrel fold metal-dependent hydrolase
VISGQAMIVVDSHCHIATSWYEPVESLLYQMDRYDVCHAILIQMLGQYDNHYLFECVRRHPGRFAPVVHLDANRPDACDMLVRLADGGASGVRLCATSRSPGGDTLAVWRKAEELGLPVSCFGTSVEFASRAFAALVEAVPRLTIVLEHLGAGEIVGGSRSVPLERHRRVLSLARFRNTFMKIHGLGEFSKRAMPVTEPFPFERPIPSLLDRAREAFGPLRLMWGSDFPPVSAREGYGNALHLTIKELDAETDVTRASVFGQAALSVFQMR